MFDVCSLANQNDDQIPNKSVVASVIWQLFEYGSTNNFLVLLVIRNIKGKWFLTAVRSGYRLPITNPRISNLLFGNAFFWTSIIIIVVVVVVVLNSCSNISRNIRTNAEVASEALAANQNTSRSNRINKRSINISAFSLAVELALIIMDRVAAVTNVVVEVQKVDLMFWQ